MTTKKSIPRIHHHGKVLAIV